ncbi:MAG: hypothetical protein DRO12_06725 [Thermoprotei archaeon]|mgnify:CR=1 FL=1|nr:MAG: hypothetical protein DRO12_06725 [Thermoprotei archaeon]
MNTNNSRIRVEVKELPQPKVKVRLITPPFSLVGRKVKVKVVLQNETNSTYPSEENRFLLLDVYTTRVGANKIIIPPLSIGKFHPPFKLKPNEKRAFVFTLKFDVPGIYRIHARVREVRLLESRGTPKWERPPMVSTLERNLVLAGSGWQTTLEPVGAVKEDRKVLRCMSVYEVLMILGALGAIISAIFSALLYFTRQ